MRTSNVVTYTVGPPLNAKNLAIDQSRYPEGPIVVTWSSPQASHEITFYTLELSMFVMENGLGDFKKFNTTVVRGMNVSVIISDISTLHPLSDISTSLIGYIYISDIGYIYI